MIKYGLLYHSSELKTFLVFLEDFMNDEMTKIGGETMLVFAETVSGDSRLCIHRADVDLRLDKF